FQKEEVLARIATQLRLRALTEHLEQEVQARTHALTEAMAQTQQLNAQLQQEIVERQRMSDRVAHLNAVLRAIRNVNQLIVREKNRDALLQSACETLIETRGYEAAWIIETDAEQNPLRVIHAGNAAGRADFVSQAQQGSWPAWLAQVFDPAQSFGVEKPPCPGAKSTPAPGKLGVRLHHGQTGYGVLVVSLLCVLLDDAEERALLEEVASDIAYALANLEQEQQRRQAEAERERLLAELREQAQRVQQIIDTVPEGVLLLNARGHVVQANPVARNDLARLTEEPSGMPITHLGDWPLAALLAPPATRGLWHEVQAEDHIYEIIARPVTPGAAAGDWVMVLNDVTRQREITRSIQRQERLAVVGQLAAGIAHDFNNILAVVTLYAQMLSRAVNLSPRERERATIIYQQSQHAAKLIQQILDFSRKSILERQALDLVPLFKEQIKLFHRTLPENIKITFAAEADSCVVYADPTRMQQMLMNLVVNARDAMPEGGELHVSLTKEALPPTLRFAPPPEAESDAPPLRQEWVCIRVKDTGVGIRPEVLPHIYEPFFTTKAPGSGSGLGLAQVQGIVSAHDGVIDVQTAAGEGSTFTICLPAMTPARSLAPAEELPDSSLPLGHHELILVVEDNLPAQQALIESLELLQYRVLAAGNGREALTLLAQHVQTVNLIMSDMVMPEMGGRLLLQTLQARGIHIPVILLTGHPLTQELEDLRASGPDALVVEWLLKPYSLEQLALTVAEVLTRVTAL
ncbi:MAG TPA: ATP-binding protein, partial [Anaerolineae bacterium]|nr:ATP-binding protein [Anaerolineae bacterium]